MPITSLSIDHFRNLKQVNLQFSPQLNLFVGMNAAGKTSLLESLYVLARARSFRTRNLDKVIHRDADHFQLVARIRQDEGREQPVGMRRSEKKLIARIDGQAVRRLSDLATLFPVQWVGGNLHRLIEEGPVYRRQYLDWGLFHVKPAYMLVWKRYQKVLKQRNAALRVAASHEEIQAWNTELATVGGELNSIREAYVSRLQAAMRDTGMELLEATGPASIRFRKGWSAEQSLLEALEQGLSRDREQGYTRAGPHRADLNFLMDDRPIEERLSRGQQKLFVIGLQVAQAQLLKEEQSQTSLFLIDDLGSELDPENQGRVMRLLQSADAQVFVTAINELENGAWGTCTCKRFHVKHGTVSEML